MKDEKICSSDEMVVLVSFYIWSSSLADSPALQNKEHLQVLGVGRYFIMVSAENPTLQHSTKWQKYVQSHFSTSALDPS